MAKKSPFASLMDDPSEDDTQDTPAKSTKKAKLGRGLGVIDASQGVSGTSGAAGAAAFNALTEAGFTAGTLNKIKEGNEAAAAASEGGRRKAIDTKDATWLHAYNVREAKNAQAELERRATYGTANPLLAAKVAATGVGSPDFAQLAVRDPEGAAAAVHHAKAMLGLEAPTPTEAAFDKDVRGVKRAPATSEGENIADTLFGGKVSAAERDVTYGQQREAATALTAQRQATRDAAAQAKEAQQKTVLDVTNRLLEAGRNTGQWDKSLDALQQYQLNGGAERDGLHLGHIRQIQSAVNFAAKAHAATALNVGGVDIKRQADLKSQAADASHDTALESTTPDKALPTANDYAQQSGGQEDEPMGSNVFGQRE